MLQVLKPFEVRAGDTTTVGKKIRGAHNSALGEDFFSSVGSGAVSTFKDSLNLNLASVLFVKRLLNSSGDKEISLLFHEEVGVLKLGFGSAGESVEGTLLGHPVLDGLNIKTLGVVDSRVVLNYGSDLASVFLEELTSPVSDSTKALNNEGLSLDANLAADLVAEGFVAEKLADAVVDTKTGRLGATVDTSLGDELSSAATLSVDVLFTSYIHVCVLNPGHDLLVGSHVGTEAIDSGTDKALLDEFHSVLASYTFKFGLGKGAGVNCNSTFASTEGNISNGKFESHKAGKSLNLLKIDVGRVTGTTLAGELVSRVLGTVAGDSVKVSVVTTEGDVESDDRVARLDHLKVLGIDSSFGSSRVVEKLDLLKETGLVVFV